MSAAARLPCCVPFCRSTRGLRKADAGRMPGEWICAAHWRLVSPEKRRAKAKLQRLAMKAWTRGRTLPRLFCAAGDAWEAAKAEAIERAMGITA